jgi:hypothetical protein
MSSFDWDYSANKRCISAGSSQRVTLFREAHFRRQIISLESKDILSIARTRDQQKTR